MSGETDWMSLTEWVIALRDLHKQAQLGKLPPDELRRYHEERDTLAKAILAAQRLRASPGARGRQALRVARELNVELTVDGRKTQTRTLDLGAGGFAVMLAAPPRTGALVEFTLELEGERKISGKARVLSLQRKGKPYRVAFRFEPLEAEEREDLNTTIFDIALEGVMPKGK
ncbi:MAG TPA: PilZ domain-containing protein [Myxococcales bacterium]|nr:PilZ domain-containing protein [Myxococcales bacterium]